MKLIIAALTIAVIGCAALIPKREMASLYSPMPKPISHPTFETLRHMLDNPAIDTVEAVLAQFERNDPDFLRQRVAAYESGSIQEGSFTEPRVIVFGLDAKFVFTFNGGPHQYGGASLETMQFDSINKQFLFREITFKHEAGTAPTGLDANEIEAENDRWIISKPNPAKCLVCHGQAHPGPIQDNHYTWAGFYGSNDDLLFGSFNKSNYQGHGGYSHLVNLNYPRSQGRWLDLPNGVADAELDGYLKYLKGAPTHPRFRHLPPQVFEAGFRQFAQGLPTSQIDQSTTIAGEAARTKIGEPDRINNHYTKLLLNLEFASLVAEIERKPGLKETLKRIATDMLSDDYYPFYFGRGRMAFTTDWQAYFKNKINQSGHAKFARLNSAFGSYYKKIVTDELAMQNSTVQQTERIFNHELVINPGWPGYGDIAETQKGYEAFLGRRLTRTEILGLDGEASRLPSLALLGFILKSRGINLRDYDINSRLYSPAGGRVRAISFHDGFLELFNEYLGVSQKQ